MAFLATAVANDFLDLAGSESCPLSQMQVQKLLYFSHGWHLALRGEPLTVEPFEAWDYGPVVRRLWERLRKYGSKPVTEKIPDYVFSGGKFSTIVSGIEISPESGGYASLEIVRSIWAKYGKFSGAQLSALTHVQDGPWFAARTKGLPFIPDESIKSYFESLKGM